MPPRLLTRHRRLGLYCIVLTLTLWVFLGRLWYGFDKSDTTTGLGDRIVTIEVWTYHYSAAWSVDQRSIQAHTDDSPAIHVALTEEERAAILIALDNIPGSLRGTFTRSKGSVDGLSVSVGFTPDGRYRHDQIGAYEVYLRELEPLFCAINAPLPDAYRIKYNEHTLESHKRYPLRPNSVERLTQSEFNRSESSFFLFLPNSSPTMVPIDDIIPPELAMKLYVEHAREL